MTIPAGLWALTILIGVTSVLLIRAAAGRYAGISRMQFAWRLVEDSVCVFFVIGMLGASALQVIARYVFADQVSIAWTEEFLRLLLVWGVLWGAMIVQREDDQICMTVLYDNLPNEGRWIARLLSDLIVLGCLGLIFWYGLENSANLFGISTTSLGVPLSAFSLAIPVTAGFMGVFTAATFVRRLRRGVRSVVSNEG